MDSETPSESTSAPAVRGQPCHANQGYRLALPCSGRPDSEQEATHKEEAALPGSRLLHRKKITGYSLQMENRRAEHLTSASPEE